MFGFSTGPGGFRKVRQACRKHFHLFWYPSDAVVTSYGPQIFLVGLSFTVYGITGFCRLLSFCFQRHGFMNCFFHINGGLLTVTSNQSFVMPFVLNTSHKLPSMNPEQSSQISKPLSNIFQLAERQKCFPKMSRLPRPNK